MQRDGSRSRKDVGDPLSEKEMEKGGWGGGVQFNPIHGHVIEPEFYLDRIITNRRIVCHLNNIKFKKKLNTFLKKIK